MKFIYLFLFTILSFTIKSQVADSLILNDIKIAQNLIESNVVRTLELANSAFITSREQGFDKGIAESYLLVGRCYIQTADYASAKRSIETALKFAEKIKDKVLISDCYFYLGRACFIIGNNELQLSLFNKSFAIRKDLNDQKRLADCYHGFGNVYLSLQKDSAAESYFIKARDIRKKINDLRGLAGSINNLAIIAEHRGDTVLYRKMMYQSLDLNEQTENVRYIATNHGNLGLSYLAQKNFDSAWHHCYIAFEIRKSNDFKDHLSGSYKDLGDILFAEKKYPEALAYYKQGAEIAQSISGDEWMVKNYTALADAYAKLDSQDLNKKYTELAEKIRKEHEADTLLSKTISLPPAFDFKDPEKSKPGILWWLIGATVLLSIGGFVVYRMKK